MKMIHSSLLRSLVLALGLSLCGAGVAYGIIQNRKLSNAIEVRGLAERLVKSNEAVWAFSYRVRGETLEEVHRTARRTQTAIERYLGERQIPKSEITREALSVFDRRSQNYSQKDSQKLPRFEGSGKFIISSTEIDRLSQARDATESLLKEDVLIESSSIAYYFTDLNRIKPQMLREATSNAQEAAQSFAQDSGAKIGGIRSANQGYFTIGSPFSEYDYGQSLMKRVRVVTTVSYFIKN